MVTDLYPFWCANGDLLGPFELTKLASIISVLMAEKGNSMADPIRLSYQRKGTFKQVRNIIVNRGIMGMYSGFSLHLR